MNIVLGAAVALSAVAGDIVEAVVVSVIIIVNSSISFYQEYSSERTLDALRKMSSPVASVLRNGVEEEVPATAIVVGDIVILREGGQVPADMRLIEVANIEVDEALLTGESLPVRKNIRSIEDERAPLGDRKCMAYKNTVVTIGRAVGVVTAVGMETEIGKIAKSLNSARKGTSPLNRAMNLMMFGLLACAAVLAVVVFAANSFNITTEVLLYALALSVAIIPEALPAVMTLSYSSSIKMVAKQKAVIRHMTALEAIGCVTDICSDKTGTLTLGRMTTVSLWTMGGVYDLRLKPESARVDDHEAPLSLRMVHLVASLCNSASMVEREGVMTGVGDATEVALLRSAHDAGYQKERLLSPTGGEYTVETEMPFDSSIKRMSVVVRRRSDNALLVLGKGAVEVVLDCSSRIIDVTGEIVPMTQAHRDRIMHVTQQYADDALRVLALAYREEDAATSAANSPCTYTLDDRERLESDWIFCGLGGLQDPARPETAPAVARCKKAGIVVRMVTGDHPRTAAAIAKQVGILEHSSQMMTARDFDALTDAEIDALEELPRVVARCAPDSKVRLIHALHRRKKIAAMTGDGVNDAPAVSHADVGIAMGLGGTDVTKQAADVVLTDDNFATIVMAVAEGRRVIGNIAKFTLHLLSGNVAVVLLLVAGLGVVGVPSEKVYPMSALQILWMNVATSATPALLLGMYRGKQSVMKNKPRTAKQVVFSMEQVVDVVVFGAISGLLTLMMFALVIRIDPDGDFQAVGCNESIEHPGCDVVYRARSTAFLCLCLSLLVHTYNCLDVRGTIFNLTNLSHRGILIGVGANVLVLFPLVYVPYLNTKVFKQAAISWEWGLVILAISVFVVGSEIYKLIKRAYFKLPLIPPFRHRSEKYMKKKEEAMLSKDKAALEGISMVLMEV